MMLIITVYDYKIFMHHICLIGLKINLMSPGPLLTFYHYLLVTTPPLLNREGLCLSADLVSQGWVKKRKKNDPSKSKCSFEMYHKIITR